MALRRVTLSMRDQAHHWHADFALKSQFLSLLLRSSNCVILSIELKTAILMFENTKQFFGAFACS